MRLLNSDSYSFLPKNRFANVHNSILLMLFASIFQGVTFGPLFLVWLLKLTGENSTIGLVNSITGLVTLLILAPVGWLVDYAHVVSLPVPDCIRSCLQPVLRWFPFIFSRATIPHRIHLSRARLCSLSAWLGLVIIILLGEAIVSNRLATAFYIGLIVNAVQQVVAFTATEALFADAAGKLMTDLQVRKSAAQWSGKAVGSTLSLIVVWIYQGYQFASKHSGPVEGSSEVHDTPRATATVAPAPGVSKQIMVDTNGSLLPSEDSVARRVEDANRSKKSNGVCKWLGSIVVGSDHTDVHVTDAVLRHPIVVHAGSQHVESAHATHLDEEMAFSSNDIVLQIVMLSGLTALFVTIPLLLDYYDLDGSEDDESKTSDEDPNASRVPTIERDFTPITIVSNERATSSSEKGKHSLASTETTQPSSPSQNVVGKRPSVTKKPRAPSPKRDRTRLKGSRMIPFLIATGDILRQLSGGMGVMYVPLFFKTRFDFSHGALLIFEMTQYVFSYWGSIQAGKLADDAKVERPPCPKSPHQKGISPNTLGKSTTNSNGHGLDRNSSSAHLVSNEGATSNRSSDIVIDTNSGGKKKGRGGVAQPRVLYEKLNINTQNGSGSRLGIPRAYFQRAPILAALYGTGITLFFSMVYIENVYLMVVIAVLRAAFFKSMVGLDRAVLSDYTSSSERGRWNAVLSFNAQASLLMSYFGGCIADAAKHPRNPGREYRVVFYVCSCINTLCLLFCYVPLLYLLRNEGTGREFYPSRRASAIEMGALGIESQSPCDSPTSGKASPSIGVVDDNRE